MLDRAERTLRESDRGFPHYADPDSGEWSRSPDGDWTGGFWNGVLWLATAADDRFRPSALEWTERMCARVDSETVFRGFLFWYGAALGALLAGESRARVVALEGALGLARLYNPQAGLIPLGDDAEEASSTGRGEANIDGVPGGTPLLAWAARETNRPELAEWAATHVRRHLELCMRDDGSVCQSATFNPETGAAIRRYTHKGVHDDSTWTRAQAWAMLGLAQASAWTAEDFTGPLTRVCDWWVEHLPEDRVALWDFDAPMRDDTERDTSGTAIAAAALLKAAELVPARAAGYRACAHEMVDALVGHHLTPVTPEDPRPPGILLDGCYNRRIDLATRNELIWGDYFLLEALMVRSGRLEPLSI